MCEQGTKVFMVDGKALSLRNTFELKDASGAVLATIHKKFLAVNDAMEIEQDGAVAATVHRHVLSLLHHRTTIDIPGRPRAVHAPGHTPGSAALLLEDRRILFTGDLIDAAEARDWGLVEWVVDGEELDDRVMAYCQRAAMLPMDALTIHKQAVNRWSELMGARVAALEMVDMDALYHTTPAYFEFNRRIREHGLRHALTWRDGPFKVARPASSQAAAEGALDAVSDQSRS